MKEKYNGEFLKFYWSVRNNYSQWNEHYRQNSETRKKQVWLGTAWGRLTLKCNLKKNPKNKKHALACTMQHILHTFLKTQHQTKYVIESNNREHMLNDLVSICTLSGKTRFPASQPNQIQQTWLFWNRILKNECNLSDKKRKYRIMKPFLIYYNHWVQRSIRRQTEMSGRVSAGVIPQYM